MATAPNIVPIRPAAIFQHSPMKRAYQMVAYDRNGGPIEYMLTARRTERQAINHANFKAIWHKARRFAVRNDQGVVLYDGPTLDALGGRVFS